ncbi:hypothetical protein J6590_055777 [Homalodisca vitripennis]|nr:hypothetical protein J6590_055777 [Homalodisca vitripennis]
MSRPRVNAHLDKQNELSQQLQRFEGNVLNKIIINSGLGYRLGYYQVPAVSQSFPKCAPRRRGAPPASARCAAVVYQRKQLGKVRQQSFASRYVILFLELVARQRNYLRVFSEIVVRSRRAVCYYYLQSSFC